MSSVDKRFQAEFAPLTLCWVFPLMEKDSSVPASVKATLTSLGTAHLAAYISPFGRACESLRSFGEGEIFDFRYCKANHESYLEAPFGFAPCNNGTAEPGPRAFRLRRGSLRKRLLPQASIRTPQLLAYYWLWRVTDATLQAERPLGLSRLQRVNIICGSYVTFADHSAKTERANAGVQQL